MTPSFPPRPSSDLRAIAGGDIDVERGAVGDDAVAVPDVGASRGEEVQVQVGAVAVPGQQDPQLGRGGATAGAEELGAVTLLTVRAAHFEDRKSTRLNSSH